MRIPRAAEEEEMFQFITFQKVLSGIIYNVSEVNRIIRIIILIFPCRAAQISF